MFVLSKVFWLLAKPANLFVLGLAAGCALLWTRRGRGLGRAVVTALTLAAVAVAVLPLGAWVLSPLENRFAPPKEPLGRVDGVVVLGGTGAAALTALRGAPQLDGSAERLFALLDLARRYPDAKLVFTGGSAAIAGPDLREAPVIRAALEQAGLDTDRVIFENAARNTYENALLAKKLARPAAGERWLLVTSAFHMPRAVGVFRRAGWPVVAYPVDYRTRPSPGFRLAFNFSGGLSALGYGLKEWLGLLAYRLLGRTDSIFPAPDG